MTAPGDDLASLERAIGHQFADPGLLRTALTHASMAGVERRGRVTVNERLEFLGDRVLGLIIAEWLLDRFPDEAEGKLARRHTALVRAEMLTKVALTLDLGRHMLLAPSEQGGLEGVNPGVLADACEAVIGALYQDAGLDAVRRFIRAHWTDDLDSADQPPQDPKTALQEWALGKGKGLPHYETLSRTGPDHAPVFVVQVSVKGQPPETAEGASKRAAEKEAAAALLRQIGKTRT
ncbi:MAG: ribonuclease [Pseudomonadota bacterium]|jgi:ribonuclease-3